MEYLNGERNNIEHDIFVRTIQPIRVDFQKRSVMKYFHEKYKKELQQINPVLEFYLNILGQEEYVLYCIDFNLYLI
jgi:hypothetical protein